MVGLARARQQLGHVLRAQVVMLVLVVVMVSVMVLVVEVLVRLRLLLLNAIGIEAARVGRRGRRW